MIGDPDRALLLDVSRPIWRAAAGLRPTGIDRVCLAYVEHYRRRARAVIQRPGLRRVLPLAASGALFDLLLAGSPPGTMAFARLAARHLGALARSKRATGALYLNVGHTGLDRSGLRAWVARTGVRPVYMVHDLIPITHPEYTRPGETARHAARLATMVDTGAGVIVNSAATADALAAWAGARALVLPPVLVAWLGSAPLPDSAEPRPPLDQPYFVMLGTIEGRKNHLLLLQLWRALATRLGTAMPVLVVIGRRGWAAEAAFALLDRAPDMKRHVIEIPQCDDTTLARYLDGARALLFPTFAEGYGLPLVEALARGVPVIASDLPVFRELAGDHATYLDPLDAPAWERAILDLARRPPDRRAAFEPPRWADHFAAVDAWLAALR